MGRTDEAHSPTGAHCQGPTVALDKLFRAHPDFVCDLHVGPPAGLFYLDGPTSEQLGASATSLRERGACSCFHVGHTATMRPAGGAVSGVDQSLSFCPAGTTRGNASAWLSTSVTHRPDRSCCCRRRRPRGSRLIVHPLGRNQSAARVAAAADVAVTVVGLSFLAAKVHTPLLSPLPSPSQIRVFVWAQPSRRSCYCCC